jgi:ketosteroid isomerase-like protein
MSGAELAKKSLEAFNRRDAEAISALQHPEVEVVPITGAMEGRTYRGSEEIRDFMRTLDLDFEVFEARPREFYELEDRALALGTWYARGRGSGLELNSQPAAWFVRVRDGLVYRWRTYTDRAEGLEALGATEGELAGLRVYPD